MHYFRGCAHAGLNHFDEALLEFDTHVLPLEQKLKDSFFDYQIVAYSLVEKGDLLLRRGTDFHKLAESVFKEAHSKTGYMFEK